MKTLVRSATEKVTLGLSAYTIATAFINQIQKLNKSEVPVASSQPQNYKTCTVTTVQFWPQFCDLHQRLSQCHYQLHSCCGNAPNLLNLRFYRYHSRLSEKSCLCLYVIGQCGVGRIFGFCNFLKTYSSTVVFIVN